MIPLPNCTGLLQLHRARLFEFPAHHDSFFQDRSQPQRQDEIGRLLFGHQDLLSQTNGFPQPYTALQPQNALSQTVRINCGLDASRRPCCCMWAPAICTRPIRRLPRLTIRRQLFPQGLPFPHHSSPISPACISTRRRRLERRRRLPGRCNTGVAFTLTPHAHGIPSRPLTRTSPGSKAITPTSWAPRRSFEGIQSVNASRADGQFGFCRRNRQPIPCRTVSPSPIPPAAVSAMPAFLLGAGQQRSYWRRWRIRAWATTLSVCTCRTAGRSPAS